MYSTSRHHPHHGMCFCHSLRANLAFYGSLSGTCSCILFGIVARRIAVTIIPTESMLEKTKATPAPRWIVRTTITTIYKPLWQNDKWLNPRRDELEKRVSRHNPSTSKHPWWTKKRTSKNIRTWSPKTSEGFSGPNKSNHFGWQHLWTRSDVHHRATTSHRPTATTPSPWWCRSVAPTDRRFGAMVVVSNG